MLRGLALIGAVGAGAAAQQGKKRMLKLTLRSRQAEPGGAFRATERRQEWAPSQTAIIVCDMWNQHWCRGATQRVGEVAPRMNRFLETARERGVFIIHAASSCMAAYDGTSARLAARNAPAASHPKEIGQWCYRIPAEEQGEYPLDQSDGGCDDEPKCDGGSPWTRQTDLLRIDDRDAISDSGTEIWNLFEARGIRNAMLLGVHTNMCVLGRPFGLRNLARYGKNVVLVRDLTDTMYNSRARPFVNHFRGTDLIVEHIEKFVCPTITSDQVLGGKPFRFAADPDR